MNIFGKIVLVILNAELEPGGLAIADFSEEQYDSLFNTNTNVALFAMQSTANILLATVVSFISAPALTGLPSPGYACHGSGKIVLGILSR